MATVTVGSDFGAQEKKTCHCFHFFPSYLPWSDGTRYQIPWPWFFLLLMLGFKLVFSLSSFTFIKRLFSFSSLSAIRVVSSAYLRLLIFIPAILIPLVIHPARHFTWCTLYIGFPSGSVVQNPHVMQEMWQEHGLTSGLGRWPGEGNGNPFQDSCLENPMGRGGWGGGGTAIVHGVIKELDTT